MTKVRYLVLEERTREEELPDGSFAVHIDWMDLTARGDTLDHAKQNLDRALKELLEDPDQSARWNAYIEEHGDEMDLDAPEEPWEPTEEQKAAMQAVPSITSADWEAAVSGDTPLLVDCWAKWCVPCFAIAPSVAKIAKELEGKLRVVKLDVEEEPELSQSLNIQSLPMLILMKDRLEAGRTQASKPKHQLMAWLEPLI